MRWETQVMKRGMDYIDTAPWEEDEKGKFNLYVQNEDSKTVHCEIALKDEFFDRGPIELTIYGISNVKKSPNIQQYFFSFQEASNWCRMFLKWRLWKTPTKNIGFYKFYEEEVVPCPQNNVAAE